jgi:DUF4097 and DUF4098 domain-containing protein YvlB
MHKQTVQTGESPMVILEIKGDLALKGWEEPEVEARCDTADDLILEQNGNEVRAVCQRDCAVTVPYDARLRVNFVHGHTAIKSVDGDITIQEASGHVSLRSVGATKIERVNGNLAAKNIAGGLSIGTLDGNATVKDVQGDFETSTGMGQRYATATSICTWTRLRGSTTVSKPVAT